MKKPNETLRALGAGRMNVKYHAHALTLFAVFWSLPSAFGVLFFVFGIQEHASMRALGGALIAPAIHLWSIIAAIYYWYTERKRKVTVLHTKGEVGFGP